MVHVVCIFGIIKTILYSTSVRRPDRLLLPDTVFFAPEEKPSLVQKEEEVGEQGRRSLQRCNSESVLKGTLADDIRRGHERTCIRRAEAVKQRGISLLNEVDAQYSALQVKVFTSHYCIINTKTEGETISICLRCAL